MLIAVTGSAGYIGGQTVLNLSDAGYNVFGIDWKKHSREVSSKLVGTVFDDFSSDIALDVIHGADAVIHCAGTSLVGPSLVDPEVYYNNNFVKTKKMLDSICKNQSGTKVVFSSSAAVYGEPADRYITERNVCRPISPYGETKLMVEFMLKAYRHAYGLDYVALRYFNAAGADPKTRHGQASNATHIIARILESVIKKEIFTLNGNDFNTEDGTCVRDYVHVDDIARAHRLCLEKAISSGSYNLGTASGASNLEVVEMAEKVTGKKVDLRFGPARKGDPARLRAESSLFWKACGWEPEWELEDIVRHAWGWYLKS